MLDLKPCLVTCTDFPQEILAAFDAITESGVVQSMRLKLRDTPPAHSFNSLITFDLFDAEYQSYHSLTWGDVVKRADPCHILTSQECALMGEAALAVVTSETLEKIISKIMPSFAQDQGSLYLQISAGCIIASSEGYTPYAKTIRCLDDVDKEEFAQTLCTIIAPRPQSNHDAIALSKKIRSAMKFWHFDPPSHILNKDLADVNITDLTDDDFTQALLR